MVEARLGVEEQQIMRHIANRENFLLSGGAGSGKTYSLVNIIRQVINDNPLRQIACMTYTNAAVKEIEERVNHENLHVSTIHDFLWDNIKHFQKELKTALIELLNDADVASIRIEDTLEVQDDFYDNREEPVTEIQYKEYVRLRNGIISHDELIVIAEHMFRKYTKLCDIVKDRYPFIFIDEYQDTSPYVVKIFLEHFANGRKRSIIGFFGDAMQSIYADGIGDLKSYIDTGSVKEVLKQQNRRNPQSVIDLANKLRTDRLQQQASNDNTAPNMLMGNIKDGHILFLYANDGDIESCREFLSAQYNWDFNNSKVTKELNLTHNLIADKAGFRTLMDIYDKDYILAYKKRIKDYIKSHSIGTDFSANTFGQVIEILKLGKTGQDLKAILPTNAMQTFIDQHLDLYNMALNYDYSTFSKVYVDKDQLLDDKKQDEEDENKKGSKRDYLIRHLFKIQDVLYLYENELYHDFLKKVDYKITNIEDKNDLLKNINSLIHADSNTIEDIINKADEYHIVFRDDKLEQFIHDKEYLWNRMRKAPFKEFQLLYEYLEGRTPFSTQHKTKGTEFNNVLVILDNGKWNDYNFENLFLRNGTPSVLERTQKIFYVCCTRAKENLAVFYHAPSNQVLDVARQWFGTENVIPLDRV
ncbi:MAG: ATP-dependent helicase [Lentimicrobiaceae bacterium]|jgi:DNA helicase-2/ATP-dependent DNA helicase PcrA|nr:ATP-dependent helicase [Lentimicrobiaceae bacterium]